MLPLFSTLTHEAEPMVRPDDLAMAVVAPAPEQPADRGAWWRRLALFAIVAVSGVVNFYQLDKLGYANTYYAAAVKSMLQSWHNFFFVAFDPGGFVTVDKPPLGLWIQTASAKLFGFSGLSLLLPEALAGVLSVLVLYHLARRTFGPVAGLAAAAALAVTPISVVTNRNNTADSLLALTMLLSAWALLRAIETSRLRWLVLSLVGIGLGFNIKMLEAYLVLPAFGLAYLLGSSLRWRAKAAQLAMAGAVLAAVSLAWMTAVDLTPAAQRPYVGSSQTNSEFNLAFGYNGLARLTGQGGQGGIQGIWAALSSLSGGGATSSTLGFGGGPGGVSENGPKGLLRLFDQQLAGQVSWLLPLALLGLVAAVWRRRVRLPLDRRQANLGLWGMWLLTEGIFFSVAGFYHTYYLTILAPAVAALAGIGLVDLWENFREGDWRRWLLPVALLVTAGEQIHILLDYPDWSSKLIVPVGAISILVVVALIGIRLIKNQNARRWSGLATGLGLLALLAAPATWTGISVTATASASPLPTGGPGIPGANFPWLKPAPGGGTPNSANVDARTVSYLLAHRGSTRFLFATTNAGSAAPYILATGQPVMALGGFTGGDPIITSVASLQRLIAGNTVRYFLLPSGLSSAQLRNLPGGSIMEGETIPPFLGNTPGSGNVLAFPGPPGGGSDVVTAWVQKNCPAVPASQWQSPPPETTGSGVPSLPVDLPPVGGPPGIAGVPPMGVGPGLQLYDCGGVTP